MNKPIVTDTEFLSKPSREATKDDAQVIADLRDTLAAHHDDCVGLAANMIGSSVRIIIVSTEKGPVIMVNPKITKHTGVYLTREGCLSLAEPHRATRFENITVTWQDADFKRHMRGFSGYTAEIIQHEMDHLEGILV